MVNIWGYSHINFFAPMARFAADGGGPFAAADEFKQLVRALHAAGIQVILDVVYNHTNEGARPLRPPSPRPPVPAFLLPLLPPYPLPPLPPLSGAVAV